LHRVWKNKFIEKIDPNERMKLIDVAGGTGSYFTFLFVVDKLSLFIYLIIQR
jgi:ubiquinone/menaquinone biosynthesis C-methylase UbiE